MSTSAEVNVDSVGPNGSRLTTMVVTFPRFILPEFNTHRMFSRNGASSRAIPVTKQIEQVRTNPFVPNHFNKNAKGMQGGEPVDEELQRIATVTWLKAAVRAAEQAEQLQAMGIAKQYANRLLEPFLYTTMVVTGVASAYSNFFALRCHKDAQPEMQELAKAMYDAYQASTPQLLPAGEWHLPFITESDRRLVVTDRCELDLDSTTSLLVKSVARCARVSYLNHDKSTPTLTEDYNLYNKLLDSRPGHFSPFEHQAQALVLNQSDLFAGNLPGWRQYRKTLKNEYTKYFTT